MKQGQRVLVSCLVMWAVVALFGMHESFAWNGYDWDGYVEDLANYAEENYYTGQQVNEGECTALVVDVLLKLTKIPKTGSWISQEEYEKGLTNKDTYRCPKSVVSVISVEF